MKNPFRLRPFGESDEDCKVFFGRDREVRSLAGRLISDRIVLVHAQTGAGKSSLVVAGLARLLSDYVVGRTLRPIEIAALAGRNSQQQRTQRVTEVEILQRLCRCFPDADAAGVVNVASLIASCRSERTGDPVVFTIDQIEEVFIHSPYHSENVRTFFKVVGDVARHTGVWMVLVVRDDYLARTLNMLSTVAGLAETRFGVPLLSRQRAREIVVATLRQRPEDLEPALSRIVNAAVQASLGANEELPAPDDAAQIILPLFLQLVCHHWFESAIGTAQAVSDEAMTRRLAAATVGGNFSTEAFVRFVDDAFAKTTSAAKEQEVAGEPNRQSELRQWCEENLVEDGARARERMPSDPPPGLDRLAEGYFIVQTAEPDKRLELSHDSFVSALVESNSRWFEQRKGLLSARYRLWQRRRSPALLLSLREYLRVRTELASATRAERSYARASLRRTLLTVGVPFVLVAAMTLAGTYFSAQSIELSKAKETLLVTQENAQAATKALERASTLGTLSFDLARASWFSAGTLKNEDVALAQAIASLHVAQQRAKRPGEDGSSANSGLALARTVLFARTAADRFIRRQQPAVDESTVIAGFDECGALLDTQGRLIDALSTSATSTGLAADCRPGRPAGPGRWSVRIGGGAVRANSTHLWTSQSKASVKRRYQFAWYDPDGAGDARPLFLTAMDQARIEGRARDLPSRDGTAEISAAHLWTDGKRVDGISVTAGGVVYTWSVTAAELDVSENFEKGDDVLRLDFAERVVGGRATAIWRGASSDSASARFRVLSDLGELVEIGRRRSESLIARGLRERVGSADVLDLGDRVILATQRGWCSSSRCDAPSDFRDFVAGQAIAPKVLLRLGSAPTEARFAAIAGNGTAYRVSGPHTSAALRPVVNYRTGDADLMVRLAGNTSALVVKNAAPTGERLSLIVADDDGTLRAVYGDRGERALFGVAPNLKLLSGAVSSDGYFSFLGETHAGRLGIVCGSSGVSAEFVLGTCITLRGRRGWEPSAVAATGAGEGGLVLVALGYSNGAVTAGLRDLVYRDGKAAVNDTEFRAHVGRLASLHLSAGSAKVWRLVSAGIDGIVLQTDVERTAGNTVDARFPPTVLERNEYPVNFVRSGGERIYAAAEDLRTTVLDYDDERLIQRACTIFAGRYPAATDYLPRTGLADLGWRFGKLDVAQICHAATSASASHPASVSSQDPQASGPGDRSAD